MTALHTLQNAHWQAGILPETGASIAFGRIRYSGNWIDVLRPTAEVDYGNSSKSSSFIMLPWANRIKDARFSFQGKDYQLEPTPDDGTARHGDVRKRAWQVEDASETYIRLSISVPNGNFPFPFSAKVEYRLEGSDFIWTLLLKNESDQAMPSGFGFHPYFVLTGGDNTPQLQIPCEKYFQLTDFVATSAPISIIPKLDFRELRTLDDASYNDLLTSRINDDPVRIVYPVWNKEIQMHADELYNHILLYTPLDEPSFAVEPQTNTNDGVNLYTKGIEGSGVFVLEAGEEKTASVQLRVE